MAEKLPFSTSMSSTPEYFATELMAVEDLGQCARLVFSIPRQAGCEAYRESVVQVIVPAAIMSLMARQLTRPPLAIKNGNVEAERTELDPEPVLH
jgi:hypothetical protein